MLRILLEGGQHVIGVQAQGWPDPFFRGRVIIPKAT